MRVDNSTEKDTSGMDKFSSKVHRVHMELGASFLTWVKFGWTLELSHLNFKLDLNQNPNLKQKL